MKKIISLVLVVTMIFGLMAGMCVSSKAGTNGHSQSDAISWLNSKIGIQIGNGQCPALAREYYSYLGYSVSGNGKDYENNVPSGWQRIYYYSGFVPQAGDVAVWRATNTELGKIYGHVAIVKSGTSSNMICYEQGNSAGNKVRTNTYSYGSVTCFIRPDFAPAVDLSTPTISFDKSRYAIGDTAKITWTASPTNSNFKHYWLVITNTTTGKLYHDASVGTNSYNLALTEAGNIQVSVYAVRPDGSGKSDSKTFAVSTHAALNFGDDFYAYIIKMDSWKHLANENNNLQLALNGNDSYSPRQIWHFLRQSDGSYKIISAYDGQSLDADCHGTANETNVKLYNSYDTDAQKWFICSGKSGGYTIYSSYCDNVFDVAGGKDVGGTNVQLFESNNTAAQVFSIYHLSKDGTTFSKPSAPAKPTVNVESTQGSKTVRFIWTESPEYGDFDFREYDIRIYKDSTDNAAIHTKFGLISPNYTYTFEEPGTYYVTVAAVNAKFYNYFTMSSTVSFTISHVNKANYIVPALNQQNTTLTVTGADKEYTLNAANGIFEMSELPAGNYTIYAKQKNSLRVCMGTYQTQAGEYINNDAVTLPMGDVNNDDVIDIADMSLLLAGENYGKAQEGLDLTGDNLITIADIALILKADNYGKISDLIV